jgi:hypothetical protein
VTQGPHFIWCSCWIKMCFNTLALVQLFLPLHYSSSLSLGSGVTSSRKPSLTSTWLVSGAAFLLESGYPEGSSPHEAGTWLEGACICSGRGRQKEGETGEGGKDVI